MTGPRDWDKELADIDKIIASGKATPEPAAGPPARRDAAAPAPQPARGGSAPVATRPRDTVGVWLRGLLGVLGAAALSIWPYSKSCGTMLYVYLAGVAAVTGAGMLTMRYAWVHRRGVAHLVGLGILLAGFVLAAGEILPRTGYAAVHLNWTCP